MKLLGIEGIERLVDFRNEIVHRVVTDMDFLDIGKMKHALNSIRDLDSLVSPKAGI